MTIAEDTGLDKIMEMWMEIPLEMYRTGRKSMEKLAESPPFPASVARDMGIFSMEAFNRMFETAARNFMFKRVGPARNFQVKLDESVEKTSAFNVAALEFFRYLTLPVEAAGRTMIREMNRLGNKAVTAEGAKEIYARCLSEMEAQYDGLFKTPAYLQAFEFFIQTASDSRAAMLSMGNDIYRQMGIASLAEMDEITLDLYKLKKKMAGMEREFNREENAA